MVWTKEYLDVILVPSGFLIMSAYHLFLLYRCLRLAETTVIGYDNHIRKVWVERMLQVEAKDRGLSITVINSTISAATFLATISLTLSSLIGTWLGNSQNIFSSDLIYGDTSSSTISVKYISLLTCFLVAFASFLQCVRSYVQANFLISMPNTVVPPSYIQKAVVRGSAFWSVGIRAIYYATTFLFWIFGPIPMFAASVLMVIVLNNLDSNSTPLHKLPAKSHNLFTDIREEISSVAKVVQHQHWSHGDGSKQPGVQNQHWSHGDGSKQPGVQQSVSPANITINKARM